MKAILLHTAATDNGGTRRDAGETLTVGVAPDEIALDRAQALVDTIGANDMTSPSPTAALLEAETPPAKPTKKST